MECKSSERLDDLEALARRYAHRVHFFAREVERRLLLGSRWSDDLVSAGYWGLCKALKNRHPGAEEREFSAYVSVRIHGAVLDEARTCINRHARREVITSPDCLDECDVPLFPARKAHALTSTGATPEHAASVRRRWNQVERALGLLSREERRLMGAYIDGASIAEIARAEGVSPATMHTRFRRISRALRGRAPHLRRILLDS